MWHYHRMDQINSEVDHSFLTHSLLTLLVSSTVTERAGCGLEKFSRCDISHSRGSLTQEGVDPKTIQLSVHQLIPAPENWHSKPLFSMRADPYHKILKIIHQKKYILKIKINQIFSKNTKNEIKKLKYCTIIKLKKFKYNTTFFHIYNQASIHRKSV